MYKERAYEIEKAALIAIAGNTLLAVMKIGAGLLSNSLAVLGDGIDSSTDVVASVITFITARIIAKPPDRRHPYGHFRAEAIATKVLGFIIFFVGMQLALTTSRRIIGRVPYDLPEQLALYAAAVSIVGKIGLTFFLNRLGRRLQSSLLLANAKNMQGDILTSAGVLAGLGFTLLLRLPLLDLITAFCISVWIIKTAFGIFMESNLELMDGVGDHEVYQEIFNAVKSVSGAINPHRTRVRRLANVYIIDLDIEVDGNKTITEAHDIAVKVEDTIRERLDNVYDIMVHVEPLGNVEKDERYGLSSDTDAMS